MYRIPALSVFLLISVWAHAQHRPQPGPLAVPLLPPLTLPGAAAERAGNMPLAIERYRELARDGDPQAAHRLGQIYEHGLGGQPVNRALADKYYEDARARGYPTSAGSK